MKYNNFSINQFLTNVYPNVTNYCLFWLVINRKLEKVSIQVDLIKLKFHVAESRRTKTCS